MTDLISYRILFASKLKPGPFAELICVAENSAEALTYMEAAALICEGCDPDQVKMANLQRQQADGRWRFIISA